MSTLARRAAMAVVVLHGILLLVSLPDYPVGIDSGYHVSLARWCGEHGTAWWDHINFGPGGRSNLQGPLMHMAIGFLGRVLGGNGMDYVRANAILAMAQWAAAIFTVWLFARRTHRGGRTRVRIRAGEGLPGAGTKRSRCRAWFR